VAQDILTSGAFALIEPSLTRELRTAALDMFRAQPRSVSYTDCLVMALADQLSIQEISGFDEVFSKNGYVRVGLDRPLSPRKDAA
jgi:predicted nucleic acid-binding protein